MVYINRFLVVYILMEIKGGEVTYINMDLFIEINDICVISKIEFLDERGVRKDANVSRYINPI